MGAPTQELAADSGPLLVFLRSLTTSGKALVSSQKPEDNPIPVVQFLEQLDAQARAVVGLVCPRFEPSPALWAAGILYHLCQFTVYRDVTTDQVRAACRIPCPAPRNPDTDWSVDLSFHHLPDVYRLAAHLSPTDPLLQELKELGAAWPLSSIGIPGLSNPVVDSFVEHATLRRLYADRIAHALDMSRVGYDARVDQLLRADLGVREQLAPELAKRLQPTASQS